MIFQAPETLTSARTGNNYRALSEGNYYLFTLALSKGNYYLFTLALSEGNYYLFTLALSEGNYYLFTLAKLRDMGFELMPIII